MLALAAFAASSNVRKVVTDYDRLEKVSEGRFDLIRGGVQIWQEAPVHGAGLGGFENRYQETLTPAEQRRVRVVISHNTPVTVLSELGAIGFGLFVWLGLRLWRALADGARRLGGTDGWYVWTMLALVSGILLHALFYAGFFEDPFLWVLTAGAMAMAAAAGAPPRATGPGGAGRRDRGARPARVRIVCLSNMYPSPGRPTTGPSCGTCATPCRRAGTRSTAWRS